MLHAHPEPEDSVGRFAMTSPIAENIARLRRELDIAEPVPDAFGALAAALAAAKPGATVLCFGYGAIETSAWLLSGIDLSSRLVTVVSRPEITDRAHAALGGDLRLTVHAQDTENFLRDVGDHRFDLIVDGLEDPLVGLASTLLGANGMYLCRALGGAARVQADDGYAIARIEGEPGITLITRRREDQTPRRRGGRRARERVHPIRRQ